MPGRVARFRRGAVRRWDRRSLPPSTRVPVLVAVPPVDIVIEALDPTVELTADVIADIAPVDVAVEVLVVDGAKIVDVPPIDVSVEPLAVEVDRAVDLAPVDIAVQLPATIALVGNTAPPVDVVVTVLPVDTARIVDVPPVDIVIEPLAPEIDKLANVPPVDVSVQVREVSTLQFDSRPVDISVEVLPVTVAFSADRSEGRKGIVPQVVEHPTRVYAQNIITGKWIHTDLPVEGLTYTKTLSGPDSIGGYFSADIADLVDAGLEPWGTWIWVEENNEIRSGGILMPTEIDESGKLPIEAVGVSSYPQGMPYLGATYTQIGVDPADVVRHIWSHLQSYPDGNLGVEVVGTTPARLGTEPAENVDFTTGDGQDVSFVSGGPYELLPYEGTDCGSEIDEMAKEGPFEYTERYFWNNPATKDYVRKQIQIHHPRAGSRRTDLIFAQDENLLGAVGPEETDGTYASQVVLFGRGEGTGKVMGYAGRRLGTRIRRVASLDRKTVEATTRANALCAEELERRMALLDITEVVVQARHRNARLGSFQVGDDIPVEGEVPWAGYLRQWERVLAYTYEPDQEIIRISTRRSESFVYGGSS